jgi:glycerate kinase
MHILIAPQALKGSLTAAQTGEAIAQGVHAVFPEAQTTMIPIADGGEGTVQALVDATGGKIIKRVVTGPLSTTVEAFFGLLSENENAEYAESKQTAVIEMAESSGLPLVPEEQRDPRITTTRGVGELIRAALDMGCRRFIMGLGGSATNDGGAGMAQALGASLLDENGQELAPGGAALSKLARIDISNLDPRLATCTFAIASDVTNPLCGPNGASAVYGPQKGATSEIVRQLDAALAHYATILKRDLGRDVAELPGAGAAGGLGAGLLALLNAQLRPGAQIVLEAVHMERHLQHADLLITAEGQLDEQTVYGKSVGAIAQLAHHYGVPVLALAGGLGANHQRVYSLGIDAINVLPSRPMSLAYAMEHAAALTSASTERALRLIKLGMGLTGKQAYTIH